MEGNLFTEHKARKKYDEAVRHLLQVDPTLGIILLERLRPKADWSVECYYTNGIVIGYNPDYVIRMSLLNNVFVIAHEVMHNLMCHSTRRNARDQRLWNIAGDYCINSVLTKMKVGVMPSDEEGKPDGLLNWDYDGTKMSTESVYDILIRKCKPNDEPPPPNSKKNKKGKGKGKDNTQPDPTEDNNISQPKDESPTDIIAEQFKDEIEKIKMGMVDDFVPEDSNNSWDDSDDEGNSNVDMPSSSQELEDAFIEAAARGEFAGDKKDPGNGGFNLQEIINLTNTETVSWEEVLKDYLTQKSKVKKNWMKPSNKWLQHGFWLPSKSGRKLEDIVIMIDESGSMQKREIEAVFNNINQLFDDGDIPLCKVAIIHFAGYTDIPDEHIEIVSEGEMPEYTRRVSGGTNFNGAFEKAIDLEDKGDITPSCYIVMTDMYAQYPDQPDYPVLWMSVTDLQYVNPPSYGLLTQLQV